MVDLIVNHVSAESAAFADVRARGDSSPHAGMFLTMSSVFPAGATEEDLTRIYRPRPGLPFTPVRLGDRLRYVWTTFTPQQIDIDVRSPAGAAYLTSILDAVAAAGRHAVRLDAVGYAVKTPGTTCFMTPETFAFIEEFTGQARARGVDVLVEVHSYFRRQIEIGRSVDLVYDFALPPLVLHALYTGDGSVLARWMAERPANAVTVLDTHDGIGVIDVGPGPDGPAGRGAATRPPGPCADRRAGARHPRPHGWCVGARHRGSGVEPRPLPGELDVLRRPRWRRPRLPGRPRLQLFTPGIPQVYYVGALAGGNDLDLLARTGVGRDINRHHYTPEEVDAALARPVVAALLDLCRFRNALPAFDGGVEVELDGSVLRLTRRGVARPAATARLTVDLADSSTTIEWTTATGATRPHVRPAGGSPMRSRPRSAAGPAAGGQ